MAEYLETTYPDLKDGVLVIHTKTMAKFPKPAPARQRKSLSACVDLSNKIDSSDSPYKAIVSVLMLKEGWDVRKCHHNCGFAGLFRQKQYSAEQTLAAACAKMYSVDTKEYVSVIGTGRFYGFCGDDST